MNNAERKRSRYRVFAIYAEQPDDDPLIYIGVSRMKDLRKLFRYYRNESAIARPLFEPGISAKIMLLENRCMPGDVAYRYCLAWMRYFLAQDWDVVGHTSSYEASFDLYERTEEIYHEIAEMPLEAVFARDQTMQEPMITKERVKRSKELLTDRVSIRVTKQEHDAFEQLCRTKKVTQREQFQMLLAQMSECDNLSADIICRQSHQIDELQEEIERLNEQVKRARENKRLKDAFQFLQAGIDEYVYTRNDVKEIPAQPLRCLTWEEFAHSFPDRHLYQYPTKDGFFLFRLETMCYGKGTYAPIFLFGINCDTGERVKLRFYPRKEYAGARPVASPFFVENAYFLVGSRNLYPDVADLVSAYPLPSWDRAASDGQKPFTRIDEIIWDATLRSEYIE